MLCVHGGQKKALDAWSWSSCHGCWDLTLVLCERHECSQPLSHLASPTPFFESLSLFWLSIWSNSLFYFFVVFFPPLMYERQSSLQDLLRQHQQTVREMRALLNTQGSFPRRLLVDSLLFVNYDHRVLVCLTSWWSTACAFLHIRKRKGRHGS